MLDEFAQTYLAAGKLEAALKNAEEAAAILRRKVADDPSNKHFQRSLSVALVHAGDAKRDMGDTAGALAAYKRAWTSAASSPRRTRTTRKRQFDVTVNLERIGDLKRQMGDRKGAFEAYEESLAIRRHLAEEDGPDSEWQRTTPVSLGKICDLKREIGDTQGALEACNEVLAMGRRTAAADEGNTEWQRDVALGLERVGRVKLAAEDGRRRARGLRGEPRHPPPPRGSRSGQRHLATRPRRRSFISSARRSRPSAMRPPRSRRTRRRSASWAGSPRSIPARASCSRTSPSAQPAWLRQAHGERPGRRPRRL